MSEQKRIAPNGIPVYSYTNKASHSFYISLFLKSGSMYEGEGECGITHFLEHALIRNINYRMDGSLYSLLDKYGLEFNASTYSEMVQFYISGASKHVSVGMDIARELLSPITLPRAELDAERGRIRAEIREGNDRTSLAAFTQARVWEGTTLTRPITGTGSSVSGITVSRMEAYRRRVFSGDNLFFYITGNVSETAIDSFSESLAAFSVSGNEPHGNIAPVPTSFGKRGGGVYIKNADFTKLRFTFDLDMSKISLPECDLIYDILLSGYNSTFFIELSEKRGLFYDLGGSLERYLNIGTLSFSFELKEHKLYEALETVVELLREIKREVIPEDKMMLAPYVDNAPMLLDEPRELNFTFAYDNHLMQRHYRDIAERSLAYREITGERIREVAREIFTPDNLTLTLKGNQKRIDIDLIKKIISEL